MAAPTGTVITTAVDGNREDLSDDIYRVGPEKTPFISNMRRTSADATFHEWQIDDLDSVDTTNAHLEGDDTTTAATETPDRVGNYTQILKKAYVVSGTQQKVDTAGVDDIMDYAKTRKMISIRRDLEGIALSNQASVGGSTRKMGSALAWVKTNTSRGSGGADGGYASGIVAAATNGTQRVFTETLLKATMELRFASTGSTQDSLQAYMGAFQKGKFSAFAGLSDTRDSVKGTNKRTIYGAADVYVSEYGTLTTIPHAYGLTRDVLISQPDMWKVANLRGASDEALAKTGDNSKRQIVMECTIKCANEKAHAVIADLTTS